MPLASSVKVTPRQRSRLAIVYVRQSSPRQVQENRESTARQYTFADQAVALGWPRERVLTIDDDLGKSGRTAEGRTGFQRLVTEVTLNHVDLVLGLEMSRLARSSKDWHAFFEMCALFDTLIADENGVYDGNDPNDRLVLGLKGILGEMELHVMRNRLEHGRLNKAQRGELFYSVPLGYVQLPNGQIAFDPDEQARAVVQLLFDKFEEVGSVTALLRWLVAHQVALPIRPRRGANKGLLEWRRPCLGTLLMVLHNPMYAGAYAYGRRQSDARRRFAGGGQRPGKRLPYDQWQVLIRDHLPGYISWERFLKNQERLRQNCCRLDTPGTPRQGCAILPGLVICGRCGWRMTVTYRVKDKPYYACQRHRMEATDDRCPGISANVLDELVAGQVLQALEPAALELSLRAQADLRRERERSDRHWQQKLQRARYDAELAERRYQAVDPDNRLVAATLERQWEEALRSERTLKEEHDRYLRASLPPLSAEDQARIAALASDFPGLWQSPHTTNADRQEITRCLVTGVVVHIEQDSERVEATIRWAGGYESRHAFLRPVRRYDQLRDGDRLMQRLVELREAGKTAEQSADMLNAEGFRPINPRDTFNRDMVRDLLLRLGLRGEHRDDSLLGPGEWWIHDLAAEIGMAWQTLRQWATRGWVHGRQTKILKQWVVWADRDEVNRLRRLRSAQSHGIFGYPPELTTPKPRSCEQLAPR
jgi:DNA invertase Pin-like site-specific DNA recombinase